MGLRSIVVPRRSPVLSGAIPPGQLLHLVRMIRPCSQRVVDLTNARHFSSSRASRSPEYFATMCTWSAPGGTRPDSGAWGIDCIMINGDSSVQSGWLTRQITTFHGVMSNWKLVLNAASGDAA